MTTYAKYLLQWNESKIMKGEGKSSVRLTAVLLEGSLFQIGLLINFFSKNREFIYFKYILSHDLFSMHDFK